MLDIEEYPKKLLEELCIVFDEGKIEADPNTRQSNNNIAWAFIRGMAFMELLRSREKQCQK